MIKKKIAIRLDQLKAEVDRLRPVKPEELELLREGLLVYWVYNSNAIEGNSLSLGETAFFLKEGLTTAGKPLKDFLEARNHQEAILAMEEMLDEKRPLSQSFIKELHAVLLQGIEFVWVRGRGGKPVKKPVEAGKYKTRTNHVLTLSGKIHYYTEPIKVQEEMDRLMNWYRREGKRLAAVEAAARFHYELVKIHPFDDGNGRLARILMNLILIKAGFLPAVIRSEKRREYLRALELADKGRLETFINFVAVEVMGTMEKALGVLKGEEEFAPRVTGRTLSAKARKEQILKVVRRGEEYSLADVLRRVGIKRPTLKKDLTSLVAEGKLKQVGKGKGTRYLKVVASG